MSQNDNLFQQALNDGHSAAWDQSWDKAARYYHKALDIKPDDPGALSNLGLAYFELEKYQDAANCYLKVIKITPEDPLPCEKLSQIDERLGKIDQAVKEGLKAAELYLKYRDVKKAIENWARVTQMKPDELQAHSRLAAVYEHLRQTPQAVRELLIIASLYQVAGDQEKAARAVAQALQIMPASKEAKRAKEMVQEGKQLPLPAVGIAAPELSRERKRPEPLAVDEVEAETRHDPTEEAHQNALAVLAGLLFEGGEDEQRTQASRRGLQAIVSGAKGILTRQVDPGRILLHLNTMIELEGRGDNAQAAEELEQAMEAGLDHAAAYYELGYLRARGERLESAVRNLQHAVRHPEFTLGARLLLGHLLEQMGRLGEASVEYLKALQAGDAQIVPEDQSDDLRQLYEPLIEAQSLQTDEQSQVHICESVSKMLLRQDWREQLRHARQQLPVREDGGAVTPIAELLMEASSSQVVDSLSEIYRLARTGHLQSAMEEAFFLVQFMPTYLPLHLYMGDLLLKQDQADEAVTKFLIVARSYQTRGEPYRAIELYRRIIGLTPMATGPRQMLIDQLLAMDEVNEALEEYLNFADIYYHLADLASARATLDQALSLSGRAADGKVWKVKILHRMADIDLQSLDWRRAMRVFEEIRDLDPGDEKARVHLVDLNMRLNQEKQAFAELDDYLGYLSRSGNPEKGIEFFEALVRENQEQPWLRIRLAEIYRQVGRDQDAINHLDAAGDLLLEAGDKEGARKALQTILGMNPPNAAEYQKLLDQMK